MMIDNKIRRQFAPYRKFLSLFGDETAEKAELEEAETIFDENGEQNWLRKRSNLPLVFGRS